VADSGIGIAAAQLEKLFERFTQADSSITRRYGGTGLGLAISRSLVELMGGEIGATSEIGQGSTFWFVLPLPAGSRAVAKPVATTEAHEAVHAATCPGSTPLAGRGRLLLVEDNPVNQRVALHMLDKMGYQVELAQNGVEAVQKLASARYDLVLMDCQMPEMDGFEATRTIRDPASRVLDHDVPVVAMTANAFAEDRERCLAAGMNDFLAKPVDRQTLAAMLARWIAPAEADTQAAAS
ncbi:MAG TPA: response regulator, partial [Steroidobacteraceae bacterium]|nr:response regulator [Steroidobacteraceae bacterium]